MPGENEFDMDAAVEQIGEGLGLDLPEHKENEEVEVAVDDSPTSKGAPVEQAAPATDSPSPAVPSEQPVADPLAAPPKSWRKEAGAEWAAVPPSIRAEIAKRESDFLAGLEGYKENAAFGKSLKTALDPFLPVLQQYGIDPAAQVGALMSAHHTLALGSQEQKLALLQKLAADYGVPLPGAATGDEPPYIDPTVKALQTELGAVKSRLDQDAAARDAEVRAGKVKAIETFVNDPKNTYVQEVAKDMAILLDKGVCKTLPEAYEQAIWLNPAVRAKELTRQQAESDAAKKAEQKARVDAAKKAAAANVSAREKGHSGKTPLGTLDETLKAGYSEIMSRA